MREKIVELIDRHARAEGPTNTGVEGFQLFRVTKPSKRTPAVFPRMICAVMQGRRYVYLSGQELVCDEKGYLCCSMPIPVQTEVPQASSKKPLLGFVLSLETQLLTELLLELEEVAVAGRVRGRRVQMPSVQLVPWSEPFLHAILGLVNLLEDPVAMQVLGKGKVREVMLALMRSEAGPLLEQSVPHDLLRVLNHIRDHLCERMSIDELIEVSGLSRAVLHRKFKAATTLSPLQFME